MSERQVIGQVVVLERKGCQPVYVQFDGYYTNFKSVPHVYVDPVEAKRVFDNTVETQPGRPTVRLCDVLLVDRERV